VTSLDDSRIAEVDTQLGIWCQGDCVVEQHWFVFRTDPSNPITNEAAEASAADEEAENAEAEVEGFVVVSQTCDIVRECKDRPFVEVCPLVQVDDQDFKEIMRGSRPGYAYVPGVADRKLVADLNRVMTVEKPVVAGWGRVQGCANDTERRALSFALARKRSRAALPDDFVEVVRKLVSRMRSKHDKESAEGKALRSLREIRVRAAPSWDESNVEVTLLFIRHSEEASFEGKSWDALLASWLGYIPEDTGRFEVEGQVTTLDNLIARDYVESDPLDLGYLTIRGESLG